MRVWRLPRAAAVAAVLLRRRCFPPRTRRTRRRTIWVPKSRPAVAAASAAPVSASSQPDRGCSGRVMTTIQAQNPMRVRRWVSARENIAQWRGCTAHACVCEVVQFEACWRPAHTSTPWVPSSSATAASTQTRTVTTAPPQRPARQKIQTRPTPPPRCCSALHSPPGAGQTTAPRRPGVRAWCSSTRTSRCARCCPRVRFSRPFARF